MQVREFTAQSLNDAIEQAAKELETEREHLKYRIVPEKTRYFGHKHKEICIQAWVEDPRPAQDPVIAFIEKVLREMNLDLAVKSRTGEESVQLTFTGKDFKLLLYRNGELLNSFQYLLNRLFSAGLGKKIFCECNNFRKNKERELSRLAHKHARAIRQNGRSIVLKNLTPFERRIIHLAINEYPGIESVSSGNRFLKTLTIQKSLDRQ